MITSNAARLLAGVTLVAAMAGAGAASAQAQAPAARPTPSLTGNVAGVCVHNQAQVLQTSAVGRAVQTRLQQLVQETETQLTPQRTALQTEAQTLTAAKPAANDPRVAAHQQKTAAFYQLAQQRERELQMTEQKAVQRVNTESESVIQQVANQKGCGVVITRSAAVLFNQAMDITPQVIAGLNAKITTFSFNRETLPAQAAAPRR